MPNELNKALSGLFSGGSAFAQGLINKNVRDDAEQLYKQGKDYLTQLGQMKIDALTKANQIADPEAPTNGVSPNNGYANLQPQINSIFDTVAKLQNNPYGQNYASSITTMFEGMNKSSEKKWDVIKDDKGNTWRYDVNNPNDRTLLFKGEEKKEKNTVADYQNMTLEQILQLPPNELENAYWYASDEVKTKLRESVPYLADMEDQELKAGIYAPKGYKGGKGKGGFGKSFNPGDYSPEQLAKEYASYDIDKLRKMKTSELNKILADENAPADLVADVEAVLSGDDQVIDVREQYSWADSELDKFFVKAQNINDVNAANQLIKDAYSWAGSLFNAGVDKEVIDYIYKIINETKASYGL